MGGNGMYIDSANKQWNTEKELTQRKVPNIFCRIMLVQGGKLFRNIFSAF